jgi:D-3-phosphoglycerate dehydrogenase
LDAAKKLQAIGCFCIGVNQVDLKAATKNGVVVFNAPYSNTRSVAELVIGLSIMLIRRIPDKNKAAHEGTWMKDAKNSFELRGKNSWHHWLWKYRQPGKCIGRINGNESYFL